MKYLIVKGWLGFGDRLETLKMAVKYAIDNNLQIYVDWSDELWSHESENFYTYFKLINMPVLNSLDDIPVDATFHPAYWKDHIKEPLTMDVINKKQELGLDLGMLNEKYSSDVVVLSSIGTRDLYEDSTFFAKVFRVIDPRILLKVRERRSKYPIEKSWGIHIRGTDRFRPHKRVLSVQSVVSLVTSYGGLNGVKMTVVSDDKENADIWKRYYPQSFLVSELSIQQDSKIGNHNLSKDKLKFTKDQMNVDALADFFTLSLTERIFTTCKDSRFTHEARRLHPVIKTILGE
jgi:hypothetical protein